MIEHAKPSVTRVFDTLAASTAESGAAVFHCTAGKDRTGMMAALLLSALGVPDDVIAEDYALTAQYLVYDEARTQVLREFYGLQVSPGAVSAAPETIHGLLAGLGERYGSVIGYLDDAGVTPGQLEALRDALLETQ
jgi:protein-tyrosine phosphatase